MKKYLLLLAFLSFGKLGFSQYTLIEDYMDLRVQAKYIQGKYTGSNIYSSTNFTHYAQINKGNITNWDDFWASSPKNTMCYSQGGSVGPIVDINLGMLESVLPTDQIRLGTFNFIDSSTPYCYANSNDTPQTFQTFVITPKNGVWTETEVTNSIGVYDKIKHVQQRMRGGRSLALAFTEIYNNQPSLSTFLSNGTYTDIYHNRSAPVGASSTMGYTDGWNDSDNLEFEVSPDVTYFFSTNGCTTLNVSTNFAETNYDTKIHLVTSSGNYIVGNDDISSGNLKSDFTVTVPKGNYYLIVEGYAARSGDYKLQITANTNLPHPGSIQYLSGQFQKCPNEAFGEIESSSSATTTSCGGVLTYQWGKRIDSGSWLDISGATGIALTAAQSGNMGTVSSISFRRKVTEANSFSAYSNVVTVTPYAPTLSAGSITGATTVPYPQEVEGLSLTSNNGATASAYPNQTIRWQKKTLSGTWQDAANSFNTQNLLIPPLEETTVFKRVVSNSCSGSAESNEVTVTVLNPLNGIINGRVVPPGAAFDGTRGVSGVTITAVRTTPVLNGASNKTYTTTTGSDGTYTIPEVYYGLSQATFVITPSKGDHVFTPISTSKTLSTGIPTTNSQPANFEDLTVFTISGKTTQICTNCDGATTGSPIYAAMDSVSFEVNRTTPPIGIAPTISKSLANGTYSFDVDQQGTYRVKPTYKKSGFNDHVFVEKVRKVKSDSLVVIGEELDTPNVDFVNTTTHTITGYLKAGCGQYVGQANIKFQQILDVAANGAVTYGTELIKTVTTDLNSGNYSVTLPAARYKATIVGFATEANGFNGNEMEEFFGVNKFFPLDSVSRDITWEDATLNFTFREFPEIAVEYEAECNDLADFPIFYQNKYKKFTIEAYEGSPTKSILGQATLGCLMMDNDTILTAETSVHLTNLPSESDVNEIFEYEIEDGIHLDSLKGGFPNITSPFTKVLTIKLKDPYERTLQINGNPSQSAIKVLTLIIIGVIPSAGTFNTVSPEIPLLILRDPPGDGSYSFFEQNKTTETANRFFAADGLSTNAWAKVKVGGKISLGLGAQIETEAWGEVGTDFGISNTSTSSEEAILSISNTTEYSTNDSNIDDGLTKGSGDLYIGAAVNLLYAVIRETIYDKDSCKVKFKKSMMLSGDGFATTYMYTEDYILNGVIPDLEETIALGGNTSAQEADLRNQINVWQQTVNRNKELKANAIFDQNLSFNGGGVGFKRYSTSSSLQSSTIEFALEIDAGVSAELGLEVGGVGASGGVTANFKMETGAAETVTQLNSTTTGFFLQDDDAGDAFTIDVKNDPVYNTPVFDLVAGKSSCPFEFGTQPRDEFSFTTANSELLGIPTGTQADFIVNIANTSQTTEARTYNIQYTNSTTGAAVNVGSALANNYFTNLTAPQTLGDNRDVLVSVTQQSPSFRIFTPITLRAFDACDAGTGNLEKFLQLKAFYVGACSNISLQSPQNGQVVSAASNNRLNLDIRDYTFANITEVTLQYAQEGTTNWNTAVTWPTLANNAAGDGSKFWTIPASVADGNYKVRMQLKCATETVYSSDVSIVIDRNPPVPFGLPEPTDRVLVLGDQISATYTDDLGCANISGNNFTITRLSNNTAIPAIIGCRDNKVFITPTVDILGWVGDSVKVVLMNIPDKYGNIQTAPHQWKFNIGTAPTAPPSLPVATVSTSSPNAIREDASGFINVTFTLSQTFAQNTTINFLIAGDAQYGSDFTGVDARTALGFESSLQTGQIIIPQNTLSSSTKLYPVNDTDFEEDETVLISLISGGNYSIGTNNNVTITILKDDDVDNTDDCFNGGLPFTLTNNDGGATGLTDGTYHKLMLESTAKVRTATTVVLKGEKSITLQPGFEIENGSVFIAIMEDCPEGTSFAPASLTTNKGEEFTLPSSFGIYPKDNGSKILAVQDVDKDGNIKITFESPRDQQYLIRLNSFRASMVQNLTTDKVYEAGTHEIAVNVADLKAGIYFLKMKGLSDDVTTYHRIVIAD